MDNHQDTFKMTYSAQQQEEIDQIRKKYVPQEPDKMEQLRALDAGATSRATMYAIIVGVVGALLLGAGMSMMMTEFGAMLGSSRFLVGIGIGVVGIVLVACAYPLYQRILKKEREKIAPEILRLTDELMK